MTINPIRRYYMGVCTLSLTLSIVIMMASYSFALESLKAEIQCSINENQMIGYWKSASENGFFEEFLLVHDGSEHVFSSWLHQRPAVNGTWSYNNCLFQVFGTMSFTFHVISFKDKKLTMIDEEDNTTSVYHWIGKTDKQ